MWQENFGRRYTDSYLHNGQHTEEINNLKDLKNMITMLILILDGRLTLRVNRTPTQTVCTDAHSVAQHKLNVMDHISLTRTRVAQDCTSFVSQNCCHPRVMSRSLPSLSTYLTYLSDVLSLHSHVLWRTIHIYPPKIHGRVADQHKSHLSQVMSHKWSRPNSSIPTQSSLKTSSRGKIELDRNLGTDPCVKSLSHPTVKDTRRPWFSGKPLQTLILKIENYRKMLASHPVHAKSRRLSIISNTTRETGSSKDTKERSKCTTYSSWLLKMSSSSQEPRALRETGCNVFFVKE